MSKKQISTHKKKTFSFENVVGTFALFFIANIMFCLVEEKQSAYCEDVVPADILSIENEIRRYNPSPTNGLTGNHLLASRECSQQLETKLRELIRQGNNEATRADATDAGRDSKQSLERVIKHQADQAMLKIARSFINLRKTFNTMDTGLNDAARRREISRRLSGGSGAKGDSTTGGQLKARTGGESGGSALSDSDVDQTLYGFYDYIQTGGSGTTIAPENPAQAPMARRRLLRSLQLYSYQQERDDATGDLADETRFEITDRDIFVVENLFKFYNPTNQPDGASFFDTIMSEMASQFRNGAEVQSSDANAITNQIVARFKEHKTITRSGVTTMGNSDLNYEEAKTRFHDYIRRNMTTFIKEKASTDGHPCSIFYNADSGQLKAEYSNRMCWAANAIDKILTSTALDDFTPLYTFLNPTANPSTPDMDYGNYQPELHAKRMYHNLRSCKVSYNSDTGNWEACLQLYVEHVHSTEASTQWFVNTGQEINLVNTTANRGRITCPHSERGDATFASKNRSSPTYMIASNDCISRPLHMNPGDIPTARGTDNHDEILSPNGCEPSAQGRYMVNLGDTYRPSINIIGTQGSVNLSPDDGRTVIGPSGATVRPGTGASPWTGNRNPAVNPDGTPAQDGVGGEPFNMRTLDLAGTCGPSMTEFQNAGANGKLATALTDLIVTRDGPHQESYYHLKAEATPGPRKGTYRWKCADRATIPNPLPQAPGNVIPADQAPCQERTSSDNEQVRSAYPNIRTRVTYPKLRDAYNIKVRYLNTVQAPADPEKTHVIPPFISFKLVMEAADPDADGTPRTRMRAVPIGIDGNPVEVNPTETLPVPEVKPADMSDADWLALRGRVAARTELYEMLDAGKITLTGCDGPLPVTTNLNPVPAATCAAFDARRPNHDNLLTLNGIVVPTPPTGGGYTMVARWAEEAATVTANGNLRRSDAKNSNEFPVSRNPYQLNLAKSNQQPVSIDCTPTLDAPSTDSAVVSNLRWVCSNTGPADCPRDGRTSTLNAASGTSRTFPRLRQVYQVFAFSTNQSNDTVQSQLNQCEIIPRDGDRMGVAISEVTQPDPLIKRYTITYTPPSGINAFEGTMKIFCPGAPSRPSAPGCKAPNGEGLTLSLVDGRYTHTIDLPVKVVGEPGQAGYDLRAVYDYEEDTLGEDDAEETLAPLQPTITWATDDFSTDGVQKIMAQIGNLPAGKTLQEGAITSFAYHTARTPIPNPPNNAITTVTGAAQAQPVSYQRFRPPTENASYNVVAKITIAGLELTSAPHPILPNDTNFNLTARRITPSAENIFKARATLTVTPATARRPEGSVIKWFCDGPGKPAGEPCGSAIHTAVDGSNDFPRHATERYAITAKLMSSDAADATMIAQSTPLEIDRIPAIGFSIDAEDRKTARDPQTDYLAKVKRGQENYTLNRETDKIRWEWTDLSNTAQHFEGNPLITNRAERTMTGTVKFMQGTEVKASASIIIDGKDACRNRSPIGDCLDREPAEEEEPVREPIVLPDVAPNGAAPPFFQPMMLPPPPGMSIKPGFL